ncbi:MFS transporter [Sporolactobacillus sp. CPB3-1]|uniref:MFS transporter n=1 Tax=Sporolactobacillus mangiferae TaxID=2940498 RepID=A0ABT0MAI5_9BACL|nr:MFS transporter [Sporolactobacillus mangiferae]MCL1631881.1 MFS transporter [Sporolactobacillus mangiferae]
MNEQTEKAHHISEKKVPHLFRPIYQSKAFRALWIGNTLSVFGSSITGIIVPILVYSLTQSTVSMGFVMTAYMLPNVIILPFAGIIVDKINRAKLMRLTDLIRCAMAFSIMTLAFNHLLTIHMMMFIAAILGTMDGLFQPAFSAMRATIFTSEIRTSANALNQLSVQSMRLIGPALGGLIVAVWSAPIGFAIDGLTYLISFVCLLYLTKEGEIQTDTARTNSTSFLQDCFGGFEVIKKNTWLWVTILAFSLINICTTGISAIILPWLLNVHDQFPSYIYGLVMSFQAVGAALAAFIFGMRKVWRHRGWIAYLGIAAGGCAFLIMPLIHSSAAIMLLMMVEGYGSMTFGLIWETSLQELVEPEAFGRVASIDMLGSFALIPAGYMFTGWFADAVGSITAMLLLSMLTLLFIALSLSIPAIRHFD